MAANMVHGSSGYAAGFSAPTMSIIQKDFNLNDNTIHWFGKGTSINYCTLREGGLAKCQQNCISLCSKLVNEGGGVSKILKILSTFMNAP